MEVYDHVSETESDHSVFVRMFSILWSLGEINLIPILPIWLEFNSQYQKILQYPSRNNYTVIVITQVTPPPNVTRKVTKILSPGCNPPKIFTVMLIMDTLLVSLLIEIDSSGDYFMNIATFDSNTGETHLQYVHQT